MKTKLMKIFSLVMILCTLAVFVLTSCGSSVISQDEMISQLGGVSETFEGALSEETYETAEEAATAFVEEEIVGKSNANVSEVKPIATLSETEIKNAIPESLLEGKEVDSVEKYEVTYSVNGSLDAGNGVQALASDTLNTNRTVTVYVIKCGPDWQYYSPMPVTGATISKAYYDSVFDYEKYKNCTYKLEQTMLMDVDASYQGQSMNESMSMTITQLVKHADGKVYMEQNVAVDGTGELGAELQNQYSNLDIKAYMETTESGAIDIYVKLGNDTEWVKGSLHQIGFSSLEELTPFYNQYLDYTYFTKTDYGFKLEDENAKEYVSQTLEQMGSMVEQMFGDDGLTIFAEYFVSGGVLSGMRMDMDINVSMSMSGVSMSMSGESTAVMTCVDSGTTVVEKPFA